MKKLISISLFLCLTWVSVTLCSCSSDGYDTGDGKYSYLKSEFVEVHTSSPTVIDRALTDDGMLLHLLPTLTASWAKEGNSNYRALLNYKANADNTEAKSATVEPVSVSQVLLLTAKEPADITDTATDPLGIESAWVSKNGKYINLRLGLKAGQPDQEDTKQTIGLMHIDTQTDAQEHQTVTLQLLHNQNGVPEYYTVSTFVSIPLENYDNGTTIVLNINTYQGAVQKTFKK